MSVFIRKGLIRLGLKSIVVEALLGVLHVISVTELLPISPFRFPSTTLVVPLDLLASQRRWNLLYSLSA
jgi:hypothetical protein